MRYEIQGETLPVVICYLDGGEKMITEGGGMSWMSPNMKMETTTNGGIGKAFGRMFSGSYHNSTSLLMRLCARTCNTGSNYGRKWNGRQKWYYVQDSSFAGRDWKDANCCAG